MSQNIVLVSGEGAPTSVGEPDVTSYVHLLHAPRRIFSIPIEIRNAEMGSMSQAIQSNNLRCLLPSLHFFLMDKRFIK